MAGSLPGFHLSTLLPQQGKRPLMGSGEVRGPNHYVQSFPPPFSFLFFPPSCAMPPGFSFRPRGLSGLGHIGTLLSYALYMEPTVVACPPEKTTRL